MLQTRAEVQEKKRKNDTAPSSKNRYMYKNTYPFYQNAWHHTNAFSQKNFGFDVV